jgi:thiamine kinase-like enzyme
LGTTQAGNLFGQVASAYALIEPGPQALCHNDLVCQNVLEGDGLALIDWEYAGMGDPFFDLAIVVQHHELEENLARHFLAAYLQHQPDEKELERLAKQRRFYKALLNLWNLRINL